MRRGRDPVPTDAQFQPVRARREAGASGSRGWALERSRGCCGAQQLGGTPTASALQAARTTLAPPSDPPVSVTCAQGRGPATSQKPHFNKYLPKGLWFHLFFLERLRGCRRAPLSSPTMSAPAAIKWFLWRDALAREQLCLPRNRDSL